MSQRIAVCSCKVCETHSDFKVGIKSPRLDGLVSVGGCSITFPGLRLETELGTIQGNGVWGGSEGDGNAGDEKTDSTVCLSLIQHSLSCHAEQGSAIWSTLGWALRLDIFNPPPSTPLLSGDSLSASSVRTVFSTRNQHHGGPALYTTCH